MYFEAIQKDKKYKIEVFESSSHWRVNLQEDDGDVEYHHIPKSDYQSMDDAISFIFENTSYMIDVVTQGVESYVYTRGSYRQIQLYNDELLLHESLKGGSTIGSAAHISAGMPGKIVKILVKAGDKVSKGQTIVVMEAMKMENDLKAPQDVTVKEIKISEGQSVESGALLVIFDS